jgi:hypothetical protein
MKPSTTLFWPIQNTIDVVSCNTEKKHTHLTTVDLLRQHSNMLNSSTFRKSISRSIDMKWIDEVHMNNWVCKHRHKTVHNRHKEQEFETGDIFGWPEPDSHVWVGFFLGIDGEFRERENEIDCVFVCVCVLISLYSGVVTTVELKHKQVVVWQLERVMYVFLFGVGVGIWRVHFCWQEQLSEGTFQICFCYIGGFIT